MRYWHLSSFLRDCRHFVSSDDKSAVVKEYKEEIETLKKEKDAMAKKLGEVIVERDCPRTLSCGVVASLGRAVGKLQSLDLSIKRKIVNSKGNVQAQTKTPSLNKRLELLGISKTAYYYKLAIPFSSHNDKRDRPKYFIRKKNETIFQIKI